MRILIDFDDCVCENHFIPVINKYLGTNYTEDDFDDVIVEKVVFPNKIDRFKFYDFYSTVDSYNGIKLKNNAFEVIKSLLENNEVYFVSSACHYEDTQKLARQFVDKFNYIMNTIPYFPPENIVFVAKKNIFKGDVIIDDRANNLEGDYKLKILFTCFHNKNIDKKTLDEKGIVRANDWLEVEKLISQFEK